MSDPSSRQETDPSTDKASRIKLAEKEKNTLIKALQRYKQLIPPYIQSNQDEIKIVNSLIKKLSK
jgi:hypothetical protein